MFVATWEASLTPASPSLTSKPALGPSSFTSWHLSNPCPCLHQHPPIGAEALTLCYPDYSKFSWMVLPTTHLFPLKTWSLVSFKRKTQIFDMANGPHFSGPVSHIFSLAICASPPIPLLLSYHELLQASPQHFPGRDIPDSRKLPGLSMELRSSVSTYSAQPVSPTKLSVPWRQTFSIYVSNVEHGAWYIAEA